MRFGSQSNRAPGLPVASTAYPAALPAVSSAACFRPAAAAKIPASHRFPAPRQPLARHGLSIPAPNQKKLRAARARYVRRPAPLRARSGKLLARRSAASGPPRKQNPDPALRLHPLAARCTPAKPLSPGLPRARRCAPRKTPFPFDGSNFFLGDHEARSGPFIRGKFGGDRKAASPYKIVAARQYWPAVTLPSADVLLIQQLLQLVGVTVAYGTQSVSGTPVAQQQRKTQLVAVHKRPIYTSLPSLERPVNHPEAEYAPQFRNAHFRVASRQIDLVLIFVWPASKNSHALIFDGLKHQRISFFSYFYSARQRERAPALSTSRELEHRLNVIGAQLARARFDVRDYVAHHPLVDARGHDGDAVALFVFLVKISRCGPRRRNISSGNAQNPFHFFCKGEHAQLSLALQIGLVFAGKLRQRDEMFDDGRLKPLLEQREEFPSDSCAHLTRVAVGGIFTPDLLPSTQKTPKLIPPNFQQRTNNGTGDRVNSAKPCETRPAQEMREHGLCLVVGRVRHRNSPANSRFRQRAEIIVPRASRRVLDVGALLFCFLRNFNGSRVKLQPMLRGQFRDKPFIRIGSFGTQFMIEVHHAEHNAQFLPQLQQQQQQRHGIRSARNRHTHAVTWPYHLLFLQTDQDALPEYGLFQVLLCVLAFPATHQSPVPLSCFFARILPCRKPLEPAVYACGYH